jgi:hypothetical protein
MTKLNTKEIVDVLVKIGGVLVGSRNLGLATSSSDYDIAFTDETEYRIARKFISRYETVVSSFINPRYDCRALNRVKHIDIFLTDRILSNAEQLELWMQKH